MKTYRAYVLSAAFLLTCGVCAVAQTPHVDSDSVALSLKSRMTLPVTDSDLFKAGGGAILSERFHPGGTPLQVGPDLGVIFQPVKHTSDYMTALTLGIGAEIDLMITRWLQARFYGEGGYVHAQAAGSSGGTFYLGGGLGVGFPLTRRFDAGVVCGLRTTAGLYMEADVGIEGRVLIAGGRS